MLFEMVKNIDINGKTILLRCTLFYAPYRDFFKGLGVHLYRNRVGVLNRAGRQ